MTVQTARRSNIDTQQRRDATYVANAIATGMAQSLRWPAAEDTPLNFDYAATMVKSLADLLHSDRSSTAGLHLIFLKALDKQSGIDRLVDLYSRYVEEATRLTEIPEAERDDTAKLRLIHAIGGLKVVLGVFSTLTSHKSLLPPGHLLMLTQDKQSSSYFDPHNFLVKLRSKLLPPILKLWNSEILAPCPPIIVRAVFRILLQVLEAQGETSSAEGSSAPQPYTGTMPVRQPTVPSAALVTTLIDMGFPRSACETALLRRHNNLQAAADWLMSHPEVVAAARTREAADAARDQAEGAAGEAAPESAVGDTAEGSSSALDVPPADGMARPATPADVDMTDAASGRNTPIPPAEDEVAAIVGTVLPEKVKSSKKYSKEDLSAQREGVKLTFVSRALYLAKDHGELVFDIRDALKAVDFPSTSGGYDSSRGLDGTLTELIEMLLKGIPDIPDEERSVAVRVRLLAIIFADPNFRRAVDAIFVKAVDPVNLLAGDYNKKRYEADKRPKWLSSTLLLAELIIAKSELPADIDISVLSAGGTEILEAPTIRGPMLAGERMLLYDVCLDVLKKGIKERDIYQSCMRLMLLLTKRYGVAGQFVKDGGLPLLLGAYDSNKKEQEGFQAYATMIMRNAVEDQNVVKGLMEKHIDTWLSKPRRSPDPATFSRDLAPTASRDTSLFLQVVEQTCQLGPNDTLVRKKDANGRADPALVQPTEAATSGSKIAEGPKEAGMQIDDLSKSLPSLGASPEDVETVIHTLLAEATSASTAVLKSTQSSDSTKPDEQPSDAVVPASALQFSTASVQDGATQPSSTEVPAEKQDNIPQSLRDYTYSSFLLKAIGELIASYVPCKLALLKYNKRKQDTGSSTSTTTPALKAGKHKSHFLSYVINELLPTGALVMNKTLESRKRFALSTQAIGVVINLCNDPLRNAVDKEDSSPDINFVRKAVLESIARAYKDASASKEAMGAKYGRIAGLSHLCTRLLAPPLATGGPGTQKAASELSLHMAKLMLEKNFAVILTNALADVDLDYPGVQNLINAILSPLEHLTKLVTKIGKPVDRAGAPVQASDQNAVPVVDEFQVAEEASSGEDESMGDHMEEDDIAEEIDPDQPDEGEGADVFRNSALGMFGGELEPAMADDQYSEEEMDEHMDEWDDEGDDMMDEEGVVPSDVSDTSEGEDDEMEMAGEIRNGLDDGDDGMGSTDDEGDSEDDDEDGEEGDIEIIDGVDEDGPIDLQADITAALQNGQLEPVDDFTNRLINEGMDLLGEPGEDGLVQVGSAVPWDQGGPPEDDEDDLEGGAAPDADDFSDGDQDSLEQDDDDDDDVQGAPGTFDVNEMFRDLVGGGGQGGGPVQLAIMGGPPGDEQPILSVDLGANPSGLSSFF